MLNDPNILFSARQTFAFYQGSITRKNLMNNIATTNRAAITLNNELDLYYARYGDKSKNIQTSDGFSR